MAGDDRIVEVLSDDDHPERDEVLEWLPEANPHRLRIVAALTTGGRNYVSQLAREIGISRPLLHLHLQKLEDAGLVTSRLELSRDGKAFNYFEVSDFGIELTEWARSRRCRRRTARVRRSGSRST